MAATTPASVNRPIRLITFDLYDTLIELVPRRWERLAVALRRLGIDADLDALQRADVIAEDFYTAENTIQPIRDRSSGDREAFRLRGMEIWLRSAGLAADAATVRAAREAYVAEFETPAVETAAAAADGFGYRAFADVMPALSALKAAGIARAVISNADDDVTALCERMAFALGMDLIVTSALVGYEKPDIRCFQAALGPLGVDPAGALHIGDQPRSDVVGALATGMRAALIDRYHRHDPAAHDVPVFTGLEQFVAHVADLNGGASHG